MTHLSGAYRIGFNVGADQRSFKISNILTFSVENRGMANNNVTL